MDDDSPPHPPMPKTRNPRQLVGLETSLRPAWMPRAEGSLHNRAGKDWWAESARLDRKDEDFEDMIPIYAAAAISQDQEDRFDDPKSYNAESESPLTAKWETEIKAELDAMGQHQVFRDCVEPPKVRGAFVSHWVYNIYRDGAGNEPRFKARLIG